MSGQFSINGLGSGLDTSSIISQLMQLERRPMVQLQTRQDALRKVDDAWGQITTKLSALRKALDGLDKGDDYAKHVATTSSNEAVIKASQSGAPESGSFSLTVNRLAQAHQVGVGQALTGPDSLVGAGQFAIQLGDGTTQTVTTDATTTLKQLQEKIDALGVAVDAAVVQSGATSHRLVLTAKSTGAAGAFTVTGTPPGLNNAQTSVMSQGQDAQLTLGTGAGAMVVTRASNTVSDLISGITLDLKSTGTTTVATSRDTPATKKAITDLVDALKSVFATIKDLTKYDATTKKSGPLQGNAQAYRLAADLRQGVTTYMNGLSGGLTNAGDIGVTFNSKGELQFDEAKLDSALATNYDGVVSLLSQVGASVTGTKVSYITSGTSTVPGAYDVTVTRAAAPPPVATSIAAYQTNGNRTYSFSIASGGNTAAISLDNKVQTTVAAAVTAINTQLTAAGITNVRANESATQPGFIQLSDTRVGSASSFTVTGNGQLFAAGAQTYTGVDVQGRFGTDPTVFTGTGDVLTASSGDASGLSVRLSGVTAADVSGAGGAFNAGTVTMISGLTRVLGNPLSLAEGTTGSVQASRNALTSQIDRFSKDIAAFETRLASREVTLRKKFTAMEVAMSQMNSQMMWLAGQLGSLNAQTAQG